MLPLIIPFSFDSSSGAEMRLKCNLKMVLFQHLTTGLLHVSESALYDSYWAIFLCEVFLGSCIIETLHSSQYNRGICNTCSLIDEV